LLIQEAGVPYDFIYNLNSSFPNLENVASIYYMDGANPILEYQDDLDATTFRLNKAGYPKFVNYFDLIGQVPTRIIYNYTQCDNGNSPDNTNPGSDVTIDSNLSKLEKKQAIKAFQTKRYLNHN
jgi:hypothetical protein